MPEPIQLTLLTSNPVYYQVPLYRKLAARDDITFKVLYISSAGIRPVEMGYGKPIQWSPDLLQGYDCSFLSSADSINLDHTFESHWNWEVTRHPLIRSADVLWLHGYNSRTLQLARLAAQREGIPVLVREEQTTLDNRPRYKRALKQLLLRWYLSNTHCLYIGSQNRKWFEKYGVASNRLYYAPYSVDNDYFQTASLQLLRDRGALRAKYGVLSDDVTILLSVGRLIPKKGHSVAIDAVSRMTHREQVVLLIAGSGQCEEPLRRQVAEAQLRNVRFTGYVPQDSISELYGIADVFLLQSVYEETWGLVVNEAMNFGLPLVVSDKVGCAVDLVHQGVNGYIVPHCNPARTAEALDRLTLDRALAVQLGAESLRIVRDYSYDRTASGIVSAAKAALLDSGRGDQF